MKKSIIALAMLSLPFLAHSQENDFGKLIKDTLELKNGARFVVGQKVKFGYGSGANKTFEFVHLSPWSIAGPLKLTPQWANLEMEIKGFKLAGTKKTGKAFIIVLGGGNLSPYWCEVVAAMDNGEVIVDGVNDKKTAAAANQAPASAPSSADELKKLKDLYDSGALSKDEYETAKKKILDKM